ncbi:hypothetical protein BS78_05G173900 [Paspalum vaginatum]|nr:hypothetical protein BS78_05G173900 [Paspalum vaginatum]
MEISLVLPQDVLRLIFATLEIPDLISLPSVNAVEQVKPIFDDAGVVCSYEYSWYTGERKISDTASIFGLGDCFVVLIHNPHFQLSFARAGDDKWTWLPPHCDYEDCLFNMGLLYASTSVGEIHTFDLGAPVVTPKIFLDRVKDIYFERIYTVQDSCGGLLQIWRSDVPVQRGEEEEDDSGLELDELDPESHVTDTTAIKVHKVQPALKEFVQISSIGQNMLFLGHNQSLCLNAEEDPQLKANHVYFTDDDYLYLTRFKNNRRDVGVFDLENNTSEEIGSPQLWSNWPAPVWLIPNPRRMTSPHNY